MGGSSASGRGALLLSESTGFLHLHLRRMLPLFLAVALPIFCACRSETYYVFDDPPPSSEPELPPAEAAYRPVDGNATWAPSDDRIAYLHRSKPDEPGGIYEVRLDAFHRPTDRRLVLQPRGAVAWLRYSTDSRSLAFCMSADIYTLDLATGELRQVTNIHDAQSPDWHPDGRHIIYNRVSWGIGIYPPADSGGIRIVDLDTGLDEPLRLRSGRVLWGGEARIARDGRRVVFRHYRPETGGLEIMLYSPDFDEVKRLTATGWICDYPRWRRNDARILFEVNIPIFRPDPWYSIAADGEDMSPYLRPGLILNLGLNAEFNRDDTMFVLTARDANSEDGVLWIRQVGADGVVDAWQVTDYR